MIGASQLGKVPGGGFVLNHNHITKTQIRIFCFA